MKPVIIESPYAGNIKTNVSYARKALKDSLDRGEAPLASHLLYTQVLDDKVKAERKLGITAGLAWQAKAKAVVVYGDLGITKGMKRAIKLAKERKIPIEYRYIKGG